ncbi:MAG: LysR family transcriptional regulator [bacterium]|nr:LysR family transcriptional regulator [bacterium]
MNQRTLESFISAAYHLNFSNAALDCHITQATLSRQIAVLEEEIGVELFIRHKTGVTLTPAGQYLFSCAHSLLEQYHDVVSNCQKAAYHLSPKLRIGLGPFEHFLLQKPLAAIHEEFPFLDINCMSYTYKILTSRFRNNSIDIGICTERCAKAVEGLVTVSIYQQPWQVVASREHDFWQLPHLKQETLFNQTILTTYLNEFDEISLYCKKQNLKPLNFYECNFYQSQLPLLQAGIGITLLPPFVKPFLPADLRMEDVLSVPLAPAFVLAYTPQNTHPAIPLFRTSLQND